jgi:hypothetical protein
MRSQILEVTAFSFGTLLGEVVAFLICQSIVRITIPVIWMVGFGLILTLVATLHALISGANRLGVEELEEIEEQAIVEHTTAMVIDEIERRISDQFLRKSFDSVRTLSKSYEQETWWMILGRPGNQLYDINLNKIEQILVAANAGLNSQLNMAGGIGWSTVSNSRSFLWIQGRQSRTLAKRIRGCVIWESKANIDNSLLTDFYDRMVAAVHAGEIGTVKNLLAHCKNMIQTMFGVLDETTDLKSVGISDLKSFNTVVSILQSALESAISKKDKATADAVASTILGSAKICAKAGEMEGAQALMRIFLLARRSILGAGLGQIPFFSELYWRPLQELLQLVFAEIKGKNEKIMMDLYPAIDDILIEMLKECVAEGGSDLQNLMEAWRLTHEDSIVSRRMLARLDSAKYRVNWLALIAWALYLYGRGKISDKAVKSVVDQFGPKIGGSSQLLSTTAELTGEERDRTLWRWIYSSDLSYESRVMSGSGRTEILYAFSVLVLAKIQASATSDFQIEFESEKIDPIANEVLQTLDRFLDPTSKEFDSLRQAGVLSDPISPSIEKCKAAIRKGQEIEETKRRITTRNVQLDSSSIALFQASVRKKFLAKEFFSKIPKIVDFDTDLLPYDGEGTYIGDQELVKKDFFAGDLGYSWATLDEALADGLARSEQKYLLEEVAKNSEAIPTTVAELLDQLVTIAKERKSGCFILQGGATRLNLYDHPDFTYESSSDVTGWQMGILAGLPVYQGIYVTDFSAMYLPERALRVVYKSSNDQPEELVMVEVHNMTKEDAVDLVNRRREKYPDEYRTENDAEADILRVQENCRVRVEIRPTVTSSSTVIFRAEKALDEWLDKNEA